MEFYRKVNNNVKFPEIEEKIIEYWKHNNIFKKSIKGEKEFIFYDGPPFANGLPHYGHILSGYLKDVIARYHTMLGEKVERRFGWDCHGLPAEMPIEKELGVSGKIEIEKLGIDKFNARCQESVLQYTQDWEYYVTRQGRWVDFHNDYKTMNIDYMESVIWVFKTLYDKGLIYKSSRVMPYSWACETPVSDFETKIDNSYREKQSKTATVKFKLNNKSEFDKDVYLLVWTTTPWTLPSNLALAVNKEVEYDVFEVENEYYIIAKTLAYKYELKNPIKTIMGDDLVNLTYQPLFDYYSDIDAFKILHGDFVTIEDGTGTVHLAPGFGEDDQKLCAEHNIDVVCPIDSKGRFIAPIVDYLGMHVFETNDLIIKRLKDGNLLVKTDTYLHNYPFCWRTDTPLIYRSIPSWYLKVTDIKNDMIKNNQHINWIPEHVKNGLFGKWLENARDWSISRNRYWGCPIPVWESDDPNYPHIEVYGSIAELEAAFGVKVTDLHRPHIDQLVKLNPSDPTGKSHLRRVPEILDCWFESGAMPYGQIHYPFENQNWFDDHFPADFIVEYVAQTRGWFYTLLVLSTALFNKPPFLNCICHGVILGDGGQKMSKRLQNYPDPLGVFNSYGSDALRWFLLSSTVVRGNDLTIDKDGKAIEEAIRKVIKPLWNAYYFFVLYANIDHIKGEFIIDKQTNILDKYIIAKTLLLVKQAKISFDHYDILTVTEQVTEFLDVLNNWYIRRSRERFWQSGMDTDKQMAFHTLFTTLNLLVQIIAPLLPMISEEIFLNLNPAQESIHLTDFPILDYKINEELIYNMDRVKEACQAALNIRHKNKIRVRQPLKKVTFIGINNNLSDDMKELILDEINVKEWSNLDQNLILDYANLSLSLNIPALGKKFPHLIQNLIKKSKNKEWEVIGNPFAKAQVKIDDIILNQDEFTFKLIPKSAANMAALHGNDGLVMLDLTVDEELYLEGIARDLIRFIQQTRKDANLNISDKINIYISYDNDTIATSLKLFQKHIESQTLSKLVYNNTDSYFFVKDLMFDDLGKITLYFLY